MRSLLMFCVFVSNLLFAQDDCVFQFEYADSFAEKIRESLEKDSVKLIYYNGNNSKMIFLDEQTNGIVTLNSFACELYSTVIEVSNRYDSELYEVPVFKDSSHLFKVVGVFKESINYKKALGSLKAIKIDNIENKVLYKESGENYTFLIVSEKVTYGFLFTISMTYN